jgi:hypothetical protein
MENPIPYSLPSTYAPSQPIKLQLQDILSSIQIPKYKTTPPKVHNLSKASAGRYLSARDWTPPGASGKNAPIWQVTTLFTIFGQIWGGKFGANILPDFCCFVQSRNTFRAETSYESTK